MYASATNGHLPREIRSTRTVGYGEDRATIRVRPNRGNARRAAINESWASVR
ncbi:hypothetical protein O7626_40375 [Micromonospora sp. WMMD1102]|uniref:hypothetical protein n=1 Tax=Micromonospora sp. WMMD1102 TaxID=3016105 RepID=UPI002414D694|nr:hypothetical protein [Micromonospora sp. WMMD1102]MDG4792075.1 hypothetical protein [Micromonospora sp. WMMD1102]